MNTLQQDLEAECSTEANLRSLILFFALVCVVVTLLGVYAAITLDTERRCKEVAIRKVNGAGRRQIFRLFAKTYAWLLTGTAAVAFPLIYVIFQQFPAHLRDFPAMADAVRVFLQLRPVVLGGTVPVRPAGHSADGGVPHHEDSAGQSGGGGKDGIRNRNLV